jgi:glycosyltransferase involved in cell wall biosynthesis
MKIAFAENRCTLNSGGDSNFLVQWYKLLKKFGNEVIAVQYDTNMKHAYSYDKDVVIHQAQNVNLADYDIVIVNNLYNNRNAITTDFLQYIANCPKPTLYVNHERSTFSFLMKGKGMLTLMNVCDATICYYDNLISTLIPKEKVHKITFSHFYKSNEDFNNDVVTKDIDFMYMARLNRVKGFYRFIELNNAFKELKLPQLHNISIYGYSGTIGHVPFKQMDEMILEFTKEQTYNTENSYIHFNSHISNRQDVVSTFKRARVSWNAYSFEKNGKFLYNIIDNGLEAAPLEAIRYGCVPVVNDIHKDLQIPINENSTQTMNFKDFNCAIFTNDSQDPQELYAQIQEEIATSKKAKNCQLFKQILDCDTLYYNTLKATLDKVISNGFNRVSPPTDVVQDFISKKDLISRGHIR